jgi:hypothetical protein
MLTELQRYDNIFDIINNISTNASLDDKKFNFCVECKTPMDLMNSTYTCTSCGYTIQYDGNIKDCTNDAIPALKIPINRKGYSGYYNIFPDYTRQQKRFVSEQLQTNNNTCEKSTQIIPKNILLRVAEEYNNIQQLLIDYTDHNGNVSQKKFVKRGDIKDEVLCEITKQLCIEAGVARKHKDIAKFMKLNCDGFSRGANIVRELAESGKLGFTIREETIESFTERYIEALGLDDDNNNKDFVVALVREANHRKLCVNSQMSSKIVGAIWVLICHKKLDITDKRLEKSADGTKRNTFTKFSDIIENNILAFVDVFLMYNVPTGLKGRLVLKNDL